MPANGSEHWWTNHQDYSAALETLGACPFWLLGFDHDPNGTGERGFRRFRDAAPQKCRSLVLWPGKAPTRTDKDLTNFFRGGGDLAAWLAGELDRLGLPGIKVSNGAEEPFRIW